MPLPRQILSSGSTIISSNAGGTALSVDSAHSGTDSALAAPTLTVSSTNPPTTSTLIDTATSSPVADAAAGRGGISIPAIIGIIVGIFVLLAAVLIIFMTLRHRNGKRENMRARALSSARKSWSRLQNDRREPPAAEMQMRATNLAKTATVFSDTNPPRDPELFLSLNSTRALASEGQAANLRQQPFSGSGHIHTYGHTTHSAPSRSADESHIPNPFSSPSTSPSRSPSPSHTSTYSAHAPSLSPATMSSFVQQTPQYTYTHPYGRDESMLTASSASEYPDEFPAAPPKAVEAEKSANVPPAPARLVRKHSTKPAEDARSRELKAMQDLISALDDRSQNKKGAAPPPSAFNLAIDTSTTRGSSRLSMGEGLVTPGGHSIHEEDAVLKCDRDGNPYWADAQKSGFDDDDQESFSLPPAEVFRAALSPGDAQGRDDKVKKGKGKGKKTTPDPFRD